MAKIYVSSTFEDLKEYREVVREALHTLKQSVNAMEYYVATDERPLDVCLKDVADCDIYIGIFAWRYGFVPKKTNPKNNKSITELEYREASKLRRRRLIFMAKKGAPWPTDQMDGVTGKNDRGRRIEALREELGEEHGVAAFSTPAELALRVTLAVFRELAIDQPRRFDLPDLLADAANVRKVGASLMPNIEMEIKAAAADVKAAKVIALNLGTGESWWSTRLYLLASLAADFTQIRQIVFLDADGLFVAMASPLALCLRLLAALPELQNLYKKEPSMEYTIMSFRHKLVSTTKEAELKVWVTKDSLRQWMGNDLGKSSIVTAGPVNAALLYDILALPTDYVAMLQQGGALLGVLDRSELAVNIARSQMKQHLNPVVSG